MWRDFRFMNADDVDVRMHDCVSVRVSTLYHLIWHCIFVLIFLAMVAGYAGYHYHALLPPSVPSMIIDWFADLDDAAPKIFMWVGAFMLLFVLMSRTMYKRTLNPRSWRIKATSKGIYIQYRFYLNQNFDASDDTVMFIPAAQVSSLRELRVMEKTVRGSKTQYSWVNYIEFNVRRLDADLVRQKLREEGSRRTSKGSRWGGQAISIEDGRILVDFSGVNMKPLAFVQKMSRWYMTQPTEKRKIEARSGIGRLLDGKSAEDLGLTEDDILRAKTKGDILAAIKIARKVYGVSLKDAKEHVDSLDLSDKKD